jgi:hypothetical protein
MMNLDQPKVSKIRLKKKRKTNFEKKRSQEFLIKKLVESLLRQCAKKGTGESNGEDCYVTFQGSMSHKTRFSLTYHPPSFQSTNQRSSVISNLFVSLPYHSIVTGTKVVSKEKCELALT